MDKLRFPPTAPPYPRLDPSPANLMPAVRLQDQYPPSLVNLITVSSNSSQSIPDSCRLTNNEPPAWVPLVMLDAEPELAEEGEASSSKVLQAASKTITTTISSAVSPRPSVICKAPAIVNSPASPPPPPAHAPPTHAPPAHAPPTPSVSTRFTTTTFNGRQIALKYAPNSQNDFGHPNTCMMMAFTALVYHVLIKWAPSWNELDFIAFMDMAKVLYELTIRERRYPVDACLSVEDLPNFLRFTNTTVKITITELPADGSGLVEATEDLRTSRASFELTQAIANMSRNANIHGALFTVSQVNKDGHPELTGGFTRAIIKSGRNDSSKFYLFDSHPCHHFGRKVATLVQVDGPAALVTLLYDICQIDKAKKHYFNLVYLTVEKVAIQETALDLSIPRKDNNGSVVNNPKYSESSFTESTSAHPSGFIYQPEMSKRTISTGSTTSTSPAPSKRIDSEVIEAIVNNSGLKKKLQIAEEMVEASYFVEVNYSDSSSNFSESTPPHSGSPAVPTSPTTSKRKESQLAEKLTESELAEDIEFNSHHPKKLRTVIVKEVNAKDIEDTSSATPPDIVPPPELSVKLNCTQEGCSFNTCRLLIASDGAGMDLAEERLFNHRTRCHKAADNLCPVFGCRQRFKTFDGREGHVRSRHRGIYLTCRGCLTKLSGVDQLLGHYRGVHLEGSWRCATRECQKDIKEDGVSAINRIIAVKHVCDEDHVMERV